MSSYQTIAIVCVAIAAIIFLLPMQILLWEYAHKKRHTSGGQTTALFILIPMWLLLMIALLCVAGSGGFDWLRLGRPATNVLTVAATLSLGVVSFVFVACYLTPGFIPPILYCPPIYLLPIATMLVVISSFNPQFGNSPQLFSLPWTIVAALSLFACICFGGYFLVRTGTNVVAGITHRLCRPGLSTKDILAKISTLDPEADFSDLISRATRYDRPEVREAATARLRSHPKFLEMISNELEKGYLEPAAEFIYSATLSPSEQARFARPARAGMQRWVNHIPAPNYTTKKNLKRLRRWGKEIFRGFTEKFASTGVDFAPVIADFEEKVDPPKA